MIFQKITFEDKITLNFTFRVFCITCGDFKIKMKNLK